MHRIPRDTAEVVYPLVLLKLDKERADPYRLGGGPWQYMANRVTRAYSVTEPSARFTSAEVDALTRLLREEHGRILRMLLALPEGSPLIPTYKALSQTFELHADVLECL